MLHLWTLIYIDANLVLSKLWSGKNCYGHSKSGTQYGKTKVLVREKHSDEDQVTMMKVFILTNLLICRHKNNLYLSVFQSVGIP